MKKIVLICLFGLMFSQAEIEQIIGAGQAATNLNGQFIGSLSNFTPGAGYWFKSSSSMCFNYACAE
tara:strand:- start:1463 stop:1660 length:198 start_codon:yes stop_codon:yes gene_type:complete